MKKRPNSGGGKHYRSSRISWLALRICLSGCVMPALGHAASEPVPAFVPERHEVVVGAAERLTVLTGFLLDGPVANLAALHIDGDGDRRLRIFSFLDGDWSPAVEATLRRDVSFVDIANIDGRDRLVAYAGGRLTWFDPASGKERELVAVTSDFKASTRREVLHVDITRDLNGDGRDDLAVPHGHGFQVLVQDGGGQTNGATFSEPLRIGPAAGLDRVYGADGYRYTPWDEGGRIHEMDYDLDGRSDLVFWNDGHFEVRLQTEDGLFSPEARTFTTGIAFDSDQIASLAAPAGIRSRRHDHMPEGESKGRVLHSLTDMDGDGVTDLVVFELKGASLWKMHSSYEAYFGARGPGGSVEFSPEPGAVVESEGIISGIDRHDFDRDGQVDVVVTAFEPTVFSAIRVLVMSILTGAGSFDLEMFRMEDGRYGDRPNAVRQIRPRTPRKSGERAFWPAVRMGDVNGDGRSDVLIARNRKMLHVHLGVPGPGLLAKKPQRFAIPVPEDEEYTWLADLNGDGKQDVLMHHTSTTAPHRLTVLMSR